MYARNISIVIRIVWNSNGVANLLQNYTIEHISTTGQFVSAVEFDVNDMSQQIFEYPLGPASRATAGTYMISKSMVICFAVHFIQIIQLHLTAPHQSWLQ